MPNLGYSLTAVWLIEELSGPSRLAFRDLSGPLSGPYDQFPNNPPSLLLHS